MDSKLRWFVVATMLIVLSLATAVSALEKTPARWDGPERDGDWGRAATCSVSYYNICSGWVWNWSGWDPGDRLGTHYESCCGPTDTSYLMNFFMYFSAGSPPGYGFTGSIEVWPIDANKCPTGAAISTMAYTPVGGWNEITFAAPIVVPPEFAVFYASNPTSVIPDPMAVYTDYPFTDAGPCYPTTRVQQSYYWGTAISPTCPGSVFTDTPTNSELLSGVGMECVVSIDDTSWGTIKSIYR